MSSVGATRACLSTQAQSVVAFSSRHTGSVSFSGRRCSVASGWYTNHRLCDLQGQRYCKSPVQLYVARQPAVNKNDVIHCICHVVALASLPCAVCKLHRSRFHVDNLHTSCNAHACCTVCRSHTTTPIQHCSSRFATMCSM